LTARGFLALPCGGRKKGGGSSGKEELGSQFRGLEMITGRRREMADCPLWEKRSRRKEGRVEVVDERIKKGKKQWGQPREIRESRGKEPVISGGERKE